MAGLSVFAFACGGNAEAPVAPVAPVASVAPAAPCEEDYHASPPPTEPVDLPAVPSLVGHPTKIDGAWTVFGANHALRNRHEQRAITTGPITLVGYIIDSNIPRAPKCALHKTGARDPENCVAEIPAFILADSKDTKPEDPQTPHIKVLGWAKNWASVHEASAKYKTMTAPIEPKDHYKDDQWGVDVPFPLPAVGMRVKVTGTYGYTFTKASSGIVSDPKNGVFTYEKLETLPEVK